MLDWASRGGVALGVLLPALCCSCDGPAAQAQPAVTSAKSMTPKAPHPPKKTSRPSCPKEMTQVDGFCIDRWEAHTVAASKADASRSPFEPLRPGEKVIAKSAPGVSPQGYISRIEASDACVAAGKRLCRAKEWYRACAGRERRRLPYGTTEIPGRCNTGKGHVLTKVFGKKVFLTKLAHYNNPRVNQEPGFLALTGAYAQCTTPEGAQDMVGNLHEWVADDVSSALAREIPLEYGEHRLGPRGSGVFMGGYYSSKGEHGHGCAYTTATHAPDYHDYSTGFRCCRDLGGGT